MRNSTLIFAGLFVALPAAMLAAAVAIIVLL
jgi:hypothetical protein